MKDARGKAPAATSAEHSNDVPAFDGGFDKRVGGEQGAASVRCWMLSRGVAAAAAGVLVLLGGCIDDLPEQWQISETRLLAARYRPVGAPTSAWATAGEAGELEFDFVAPPDRAPRFTWGFIVCLGTVVPTGEVVCSDALLQSELQMSPTPEVPAFPVSIPSRNQAGTTHLGVLGIFCSAEEGTVTPVPSLDPAAGFETCEPAGGEINRFQFAVPLATGQVNQHPFFAPDAIALEGVVDPWPAPGPDPSCDGLDPTRPLIQAGVAEISLVLRAAVGSREQLPDRPELEDLLFSHGTTSGELDRFFSAPAGDRLDASVGWTPPPADDVGVGGILVRFAFTVFDERAGSQFTTRELCVVPALP